MATSDVFTVEAKDPAEVVPVTFDFAVVGDVSGPVVTITHESGPDDPDMADMLIGLPVATGAQVQQKVRNGVDGASYRLRCEVDAFDSTHYVLTARLPVRKAEKAEW